MTLDLDRDDLLPALRNTNTSLTKYEHFKAEVQAAIRAVGRATFRCGLIGSYNAIYPPKEKA